MPDAAGSETAGHGAGRAGGLQPSAARSVWSHPLCGADAATLGAVLVRHGGVAPRHIPDLLAILGSTAGRLPFTLCERALVAWRRRAMPAPDPPVFIIGHWRSGTTHLYNVMSRSGTFGYVSPIATGLPWDFLVLGRLLRPLLEKALPKERYIDRIPVRPDSPQEDEIALASMHPLSFYHGLYFPRRLEETFDRGVFFDGVPRAEIDSWCRTLRYFFDKTALASDGRRLLIKNPVYTARVAMLRTLWPDARFIHIYRNPYVVFHSMRNFWEKLLAQLALQRIPPLDLEALVLRAYARMMDTLIEDSRDLPAHLFAEVCFERFEAEPLAELARLYDQLDLGDFAAAEPAFRAYLDSVKRYTKNVWRFDEASVAQVRENWGRFIDRWGYQPPAAD
ncbi:MAG: sulfotransferase [Alphaproteobacteria bacterium]|nr:sulfotransferase [Alphaproteobacteria bacterium]